MWTVGPRPPEVPIFGKHPKAVPLPGCHPSIQTRPLSLGVNAQLSHLFPDPQRGRLLVTLSLAPSTESFIINARIPPSASAQGWGTESVLLTVAPPVPSMVLRISPPLRSRRRRVTS